MKLTNARAIGVGQQNPSFTTTLRWRKAENYQVTRGLGIFLGVLLALQGLPEAQKRGEFHLCRFCLGKHGQAPRKINRAWRGIPKKRDMDAVQARRPFIMANAYRLEADNQLKIADALQNAVSVRKGWGGHREEKIKRLLRRFFDLCDKYLELAHKPGAKESDKKYAKDFVNMMGSVYFKLKRYGDLLQKFAGYENGVMNKARAKTTSRISGTVRHA